MDYNKVILLGRVGKDPEVKQVGGKNVSSFSLATSYGTGDNVRTEWHQISVWEKLSDITQQIVHKGDKVLVEGRISYNVTGEGEARRQFTHIVGVSLVNLTSKTEANSTKAKAASVGDEDIPF
jgi:single-strand DNA-binding protein